MFDTNILMGFFGRDLFPFSYILEIEKSLNICPQKKMKKYRHIK